MLLAFDPDEVANLPQHTGDLRALRTLDGAADLAETERAQGAAMALALADLAAHLRDALRGLLATHDIVVLGVGVPEQRDVAGEEKDSADTLNQALAARLLRAGT